MAYKRILTIQDISCVGQCSMTVAMPVLSACGHETCILPTAVMSTHTGGFGRPAIHHLDDCFSEILAHWRSQGICFDAIYTGYLGSVQAVTTVSEILQTMLAPGGITIVDPAMADHGRLYSGFDPAYAGAMKTLCEQADVMLPNLTEAAMMTGLPYREEYDESDIRELLAALGGRNVVLTGVGLTPEQTGFAIRTGGAVQFYQHARVGKGYHGTGDLFAACFTGSLLQENDMYKSAKIAANFTCHCIENTYTDPAHWYGVKFETALPWLVGELFGA